MFVRKGDQLGSVLHKKDRPEPAETKSAETTDKTATKKTAAKSTEKSAEKSAEKVKGTSDG